MDKLTECKTLMHELFEGMTDHAEFAQEMAQGAEQEMSMLIEGMKEVAQSVEACQQPKRRRRVEVEVAPKLEA